MLVNSCFCHGGQKQNYIKNKIKMVDFLHENPKHKNHANDQMEKIIIYYHSVKYIVESLKEKRQRLQRWKITKAQKLQRL